MRSIDVYLKHVKRLIESLIESLIKSLISSLIESLISSLIESTAKFYLRQNILSKFRSKTLM